MSNCTNRIKLPYIVQSQAQKEVTHNASLELIDMLLHPTAINIGNVPPESLKGGDSYIVGSAPQAAWKNHPNALAYFENDSWKFIEAFEGLTVWVRNKKQHYTYDGTKWLSLLKES